MKKIASFTVDHTKLDPGIYVSRVDGDVTTYDLRMKKPNAGEYLSDLQMHSLEHLLATFMRNGKIAENVIYVGPMGCRTGFYLLVRGLCNEAVLDALIEALDDICAYDGEMPGASEKECGNYRELSLDAGREVAAQYLAILNGKTNDFRYR
ncbi:MAG: S-ribosylhomocysteine lyase [Clostridia bacterium]|nr:S-ribosylhomocysteine lyase [Clostridia bacterium]